jgi:hypothetical protein
MERPISSELMIFNRREQMIRLKNIARRAFKLDYGNKLI